jgi:hypothetical protein
MSFLGIFKANSKQQTANSKDKQQAENGRAGIGNGEPQ